MSVNAVHEHSVQQMTKPALRASASKAAKLLVSIGGSFPGWRRRAPPTRGARRWQE
jgi:hypothetical protein